MLRVKSDHSVGLGCASPEELARRAAELGVDVLALTDVETLSAQVRFQEACQAQGVRAVCGVELRERDERGELRDRYVLLARNHQGYENLCRIVTARGTERPAAPALSLIEAHSAGLFVLSDGVGALGALLHSTIARDAVAALVTRPVRSSAAQDALIALARGHGVQLVADGDALLLSPEDSPLALLLCAIQRGETVGAIHRRDQGLSPASMSAYTPALFADLPGSVEAARDLLSACHVDLLSFARSLPAHWGSPLEQDARLAALCTQRLGARGEPYRVRLAMELSAIAKLELSGYFLLVFELLEELVRRDIAHAGRGSAVGSLVAHLLGVSPIDPLRHGLLFERFAHLGQDELPDVDIDVASDRRDEMLAHVYARFGEERVAMVSTQVTLQRRAAYRQGLLALGMPEREVRAFLSHMPDDALELPVPVQRLPARYAQRAAWLERLVGKVHHRSVHPGGVVIAGLPLVQRTPLVRAQKGVLVTEYDMHAVARLGLIKLDLLGNRCLSELARTRELSSAPRISEVPEGDPRTLHTLQTARTVGCFQVETPAVRTLLGKIAVSGLEDLSVVLSLVRPGAAAQRAKASFVRRARGEEAATCVHPRLRELLEGTHGLFLYEEDITRALASLLGISLAEADAERAALVRGEPRAEAWLRTMVREGADRDEAARAAAEIARFAAYSFSKAHALAYARLAYLSTYDKTHHPEAHAAAVLDHHGGAYPLRAVAATFRSAAVA